MYEAAISIGIRYLKFVINSISKYIIPSSVHLWSDSTTALTWCISKHNIKELFIRARVEHLQSTVKEYNIKLHYVISQDNPADHLTKITKIRPHDKAWVEGPELLKTQECWKEFTKPLGRKDTIPVFQGDYTLAIPALNSGVRDIITQGKQPSLNLELMWIIHFALRQLICLVIILLKTTQIKKKEKK